MSCFQKPTIDKKYAICMFTTQTEVDVSQTGLLAGTAEILQSTGGHIQVLHATPEQVAQLQQTHQIQILQGDELLVSFV
jgi:hypothetical protein